MIELKNVSFCYSNANQVNSAQNINLTIKKGEIVLLCGESGCGKTTITRLINGLIPQFYEGELTGEIHLNGKNIVEEEISQIARTVGSVFQNPRSQFFNIDTTSELVFGCENMGWSLEDIEKSASKTITNFKIEHLLGRSIFELSGGEKQKIACAAVTTANTEVLVLDEPSASLDFKSIEHLRGFIEIWKKEGKTIIIADHKLYYLRDIVDRVIFMEKGVVSKEFTGEDFYTLPENTVSSMGLRRLSLNNLNCQVHQTENSKEKILVSDFSFKYKKAVLQTINIEQAEIPKSSIIAIVGDNGAGKSTFARCLCGLEKKCRGKFANLKGKERLKKSYMVMQDVNHQLFTESIEEEIRISMNSPTDEQIDEILASLDLLEFKDAHPMSLSGGQKQRVAVASAIASQRDFIVFDEPTSGLDLKHMKEVAIILKELSTQGKTIFLITHDLELIFESCNYVLQITKGEIQESYHLDSHTEDKLLGFFRNQLN